MLEYKLDEKDGTYGIGLTPDRFVQSLPFHVLVCGYWHMGEQYFTRRDGLSNYLLLVTVDGRGCMTYKGQYSVLETGSAVLIDCNDFHEYRTLPGQQWSFYFVHFQALSMEGYRKCLLERLTVVPLPSLERICGLMEQIYQMAHQQDVAAYIMHSHLISGLLTEMVCSLTNKSMTQNCFNREDISELAAFIRKNCNRNLHMEDFCDRVNLSRHYLIHLFERQIGMPPYRYLHMCRVQHAQVLLKTTDFSVDRIAEETGYSCAAVLIRHFKAFNQVSPNEYRKKEIRSLWQTPDVGKATTRYPDQIKM